MCFSRSPAVLGALTTQLDVLLPQQQRLVGVQSQLNLCRLPFVRRVVSRSGFGVHQERKLEVNCEFIECVRASARAVRRIGAVESDSTQD